MSVSSQYFETKDGNRHYHFDKITSQNMCYTIAAECRSNAFFERMKSVACIVATLATAYLGFLAFAAIANTYGLFTSVVTILALAAISSNFSKIGIVVLPFVALSAGFIMYWNAANHYSEQAHLADLRVEEIIQEPAQISTGTNPAESGDLETS